MKILANIGIKIEQKSEAFQSDVVNCHGISVSNAGTSNVRFRFLEDGGEVLLHPEESIEFRAIADAPFDKDVLDGDFEPATGTDVLEADQVNLVRITKFIGRYSDC